MLQVKTIDSHTAGEPTRLILDGGPRLATGSVAEQARELRTQHDPWRRAVVGEPRGSDVWVGGLLLKPSDPASLTGVVFFNNVGYLGMCGHAVMGLVASYAHLGRIGPGQHRIETPVGTVAATLHPDGTVSVENVVSYRWRQGVELELEDHGAARGDVAWGGNWFFLVSDHGQRLEISNVRALTAYTRRLRENLEAQGIRGENDAIIDHIELFGLASGAQASGRNFVLCPGGVYDRSPCGTGTSAKLACLAEDGLLAEDEVWVQEGILGTTFSATYRKVGRGIRPVITGRAWVTAESTLLLDPEDPFCWGLSP